ncbi:MAG: glycosyltransferase [Clostridia bacterium]|nr:glycosyltransferase [Clostridia bacterium]
MLSVIVPVYNAEKFLIKCVDSILAQTYKNIEVILVDDGSTDGSLYICKDFAKRDSRIKVLHKTNGGSTSAYLEGLRASKGEFITFVDSDDWIDINMYEKMMSHFNDDINLVFCKHNMVFCNIGNEDEGKIGEIDFGIKEGVFNRENINVFFIKPNKKCVSQSRCNKIYRREDLLLIVPLLDENIVFAEDVLLNYLFFISRFKRGYYVDEALYHYRYNNLSVSTNFNEKKLSDLNLIYHKLNEFDKSGNFAKLINSMYVEFVLRATKVLASSTLNKNDKVRLTKLVMLQANFKQARKNCDWECFNFKQMLKKILLILKMSKIYLWLYSKYGGVK